METLVYKINNSVEIKNPQFLGFIKLVVLTSNQVNITVLGKNICLKYITTDNDSNIGFIVNGGYQKEITGNNIQVQFLPSSKDLGYVLMSDSNLEQIQQSPRNDFYYDVDLPTVIKNNISTIKTLFLGNKNRPTNLKDLELQNTSLKNLFISGSQEIYGDVMSLSGVTTLKNLVFNYATAIYGSLDELFDNFAALGKNDSLKLQLTNSPTITFSKNITSGTILFSNNSWTLQET